MIYVFLFSPILFLGLTSSVYMCKRRKLNIIFMCNRPFVSYWLVGGSDLFLSVFDLFISFSLFLNKG